MDDWDWDEYFINIAYVVARKSKDQSTQVGAVIVGPNHEIRSTGYNGPCRGENDDEPAIQHRPLKLMLFEHAERNAIYNSAFCGISTAGCTLYCTWTPCSDCARAIKQSGIRHVVSHSEFPAPPGWTESSQIGHDLLIRLGVEVDGWSGTPIIDEIRSGGTIHQFGRATSVDEPEPEPYFAMTLPQPVPSKKFRRTRQFFCKLLRVADF